MTAIAANLQAVRTRIAAAERAGGQNRGLGDGVPTVKLLAVSKTKSAAAIREAHAAGQRAFAENYVQEGVDKILELGDLSLEWHFIGPLQSNKTRPVAEHFDWVHTVDREKIAQRLSEQRSAGKALLQVCLQVNVSGEASKGGVAPAELVALARAVSAMPHLQLRGLMCIPEPTPDVTLQAQRFAQLRHLLETLNAELGLSMDTLSMGMSDDLETAIAEGATMVRIGSAIFGARGVPQAAA
ncbi:YggS family pyridoxal phosphate-dependent enzyme [Uliginosibacterium sp. H3]|uniref:Pyridoxal phosphate homeostasis protein n=1 Tax=Uliginosibacterium silvisoli TaxID=3114758 RepID=A0ABU6K1X8_9RHOO|nr:YggS family pyridoxal phosphate-dependent enzyme [Uliginosibacterium sp. H3]